MANLPQQASFKANYATHVWELRDGYYQRCQACGLHIIGSSKGLSFRLIGVPPCPCQQEAELAEKSANG